MDYVQSLYEKKLCTYPRTDSRYLTDDMGVGVFKLALTAADICCVEVKEINDSQICNGKKVSDHHAIIPTESAGNANLPVLTVGETNILQMIARQVLIAVADPHTYLETVVTAECGRQKFTVKGKTVVNLGWRFYTANDKTESELPPLSEGQVITDYATAVEEAQTKPPAHYTEDTLLSAMECAGSKEMPDDAERKGLGTPATRAGILEKLVSAGFVERRKGKKAVHLIPQDVGTSLITVLPEQLQSPLLTAEWENKLKEIERGQLTADMFMTAIANMVADLVKNYQPMDGAEALFPSGKPAVGKCPRCDSLVTESKNGFFCERTSCNFGLWKDNRYLSAKHIILTTKMAKALLKDGKTFVSGMFSEKTGKNYSAYLVLEDDGKRTSYSQAFDKGGAKE